MIIYQPKGKAQEYCKWAANLYNGCNNKCLYCYNRHSQAKALLGKDEPTLKKGLRDIETAFQVFMKELDKYREQIIADGGELFFNFVSDPCLPETYKLNMACITEAAHRGINPRVLTKRANEDFFGFFLFSSNRIYPCSIRFGFTITGHDELEPNASPTEERFLMLENLHKAGYKTWVSLEPIISIDAARIVITKSIEAGVKEIRIGLNSFKKEYTPEEVRNFKAWADPILNTHCINAMWKNSVLEYINKAK